MKYLLLKFIRFYQRNFSPYIKRNCRFLPTCSDYTYQAVLKYGFFKGSYLGIKRFSKCHPLHKGGYDPLK